MKLPRWIFDRLQPRRFRCEVEAKATDLAAVHGPVAYAVAREQARIERRARWPGDDRFWNQVAVEIARREGRASEIGLTGVDRYPGPL